MEEKINKLINSIDKLTNAVEDRLMTAPEIAESEEFKIGYRTVLELFKQEDFPAIQYTNPKKVFKSDLIKYLKTHPRLNIKT